MKSKVITFLVGVLFMGLFYGLLMYFFATDFELPEIITSALIFGIGWGLAEVFVFPAIRSRFTKNK